MLTIIENEPLVNHTSEFDAIVIGTNCYQVMRNGFQAEITKKFPHIKEVNYSTKYGDANKLGTIVEIQDEPNFILAFISFGYNFKGDDSTFLDTDALISCLKLINLKYKGKKIASTVLGTTKFDGNAPKSDILNILNQTLTNVDAYIFDYRQDNGNFLQKTQYIYGKRKRKRELQSRNPKVFS